MIENAWIQIFHSCKIFTYLYLIKSDILKKLPFKFVVTKQKLHRFPFYSSQRANNFAAFGAICFKLSVTNSCHDQLNHTFRAKYSLSYWVMKMKSKYSVSKLYHLLDMISKDQNGWVLLCAQFHNEFTNLINISKCQKTKYHEIF